ncbi:hypothetical protein VVR41_06745 [Corynebacterium sp. LK2510]|nr:hypothetical protein [Corynebacterium sp.]MDY5786517.1 hypothetical protein [Corynebacterium sp.]
MWQTLIGFVGFFAALAVVQALINLARPEPLIWPGLLAGALVLATWHLVRRWRQWRAGGSGASRASRASG